MFPNPIRLNPNHNKIPIQSKLESSPNCKMKPPPAKSTADPKSLTFGSFHTRLGEVLINLRINFSYRRPLTVNDVISISRLLGGKSFLGSLSEIPRAGSPKKEKFADNIFVSISVSISRLNIWFFTSKRFELFLIR